MAEPYIQKNMMLYVKGRGYAGIATEVEVGEPTLVTEDHRGAGMAGAIEIDQGVEKIEMTFTVTGGEPELLELWGLTAPGGPEIRLEAAEQSPGGTVRKQTIKATGLFKKLKDSTWKPGSGAPVTFTANVRKYERLVDNERKIFVDFLNGIREIGGKDQNEAINKAIGIA